MSQKHVFEEKNQNVMQSGIL